MNLYLGYNFLLLGFYEKTTIFFHHQSLTEVCRLPYLQVAAVASTKEAQMLYTQVSSAEISYKDIQFIEWLNNQVLFVE
jgi:hypothetical protein